MNKKSTDKRLPALPSHKVVEVRPLFEFGDVGFETHKLNQIVQTIRFPEGVSEEEKDIIIVRAIELYESLAPSDGLEGMLATQMVGTHHAALDCLRLAMVPGQTFAARDMNLKHAAKLMALYAQQVAALNKHRGKGQQKVTVEHVHVAAGGQAIVGNIETSGRAVSPASGGSTIEQQVEVPVETGGEKATPRRRKPKLD
jgi:hypothetical protein